MPTSKKRPLDNTAVLPNPKKIKFDDNTKKQKVKSKAPDVKKSTPSASRLVQEDVDFPRGGGTTFTPLEVKTIRAEAHKEANDELFEEAKAKKSRSKKGERTPATNVAEGKKQGLRVEHLNYKRITVGMKLLGQIVSVEPLSLIVSLPNQLFAHIPITHISSQLTKLLETMDEEDSEESGYDEELDDAQISTQKSNVPNLFEIFSPSQYVRAVVTAVHAPGSTDIFGMGRPRDEVQKTSRRVELSLEPGKVNASVVKADLNPGFVLSAAVASVEDHGYIVDLGISDVSGFLSFKNVTKSLGKDGQKLRIGQLIDVTVSKMSGNGRTCELSFEKKSLVTASLSEVTNASSLLPGALVQSLVTAVLPTGLNLQVLGYFEGTIDVFHLPPGNLEEKFKVGQKVKARIIYDMAASSPPKFALSLSEHIIQLDVKRCDNSSLQDAYPIGIVLDAVKVIRVEAERGLTGEVQPGVAGFVHISQASDQHVPSLSASSGPWKVGAVHRGRVTGYFPLDGYLKLSFRQSVLDQKFLQVADVQVGEVIKGTIKKLTDTALFISLSENVDGVVWPGHFADIPLKHPQKRFKPGGSVKCRILVVDAEKRRIVLTAKRTLTDSTLPLLANFEDAKVGLITHGVITKIFEKNLQVEFYNRVKATVPIREASESIVGSLSDAFSLGKPVKVRIMSIDKDKGRILASIRQASSNFEASATDVTAVEIGNHVEGTVMEVHKENAVLSLQPSKIRALLSLTNLANRRESSVTQLRASLKIGEKLEDLVVVSRNLDKGFVIVANKPMAKPSLLIKGSAISMDTIELGQIVGGRVLRYDRKGAFIKLAPRITGSLHPTEVSDNYESGTPFPPVDSLVKAAVIEIDKPKNHLFLSTRHSQMYRSQAHSVIDAEIRSLDELKVGESIRGFIKSVTEHGLFVMLGRDIDARVQIKELFDEFVKDWKPKFQANQLVKGRILSIDKENKKVEMSFRSREAHPEKASLTLADFEEGQKVEGIVKKIEDYGLFIGIHGSKISGLCHKSELSDNKEADVSLALRSFREGDRVRALVLSIEMEKKRISFGLKPSYFEDDQDGNSDAEEHEDEEADPGTLGVVGEDMEMLGLDAQMPDAESFDAEEESDVEAIQVDEEEPIQFAQPQIVTDDSVPTLTVENGLQWTAPAVNLELESSSDPNSDFEEKGGRKKKRKRKEIEQDLTADMHTKMPESNADFERLLLGSPNSSYLWIQYISFQLQLSEVDKGREIARRALTTINFREEQEKLNVWIALLNLENIYGTDESIDATFKDAARHNDSKTVHLRLASIFEESEKYEKAEEIYTRTAKKFGQSSKVWTLFGEYYLKRGELEQSWKLLPRSLQSLDKRKHLKTISKFAQLEYKFGDPERGKTIFEGIVDSHPKRWDLWSIYVDMEAGQKDIQSVRNLFDRIFAVKMTSHKAKSFFKKWLELEKRQGDDEGAEAVKQKAIEWTQKATNW